MGRLAGCLQQQPGHVDAADHRHGRDLLGGALPPVHATRRSDQDGGHGAAHQRHPLDVPDAAERRRAGEDAGVLRVEDVRAAPHGEREVGAQHARHRERQRQQHQHSRDLGGLDRGRSGTRQHQPGERGSGQHQDGSDHADQQQGVVLRRERTGHHRRGEGHLQRLRPGGASEHPDVARCPAAACPGSRSGSPCPSKSVVMLILAPQA